VQGEYSNKLSTDASQNPGRYSRRKAKINSTIEKPEGLRSWEAAMTPPVCDCPEPCACYAEGYAQGKD